jgi:hypothetical protein
MKRRGFPENLRNWRFVTLTMDREKYPDAETAYNVGNARMRVMFQNLRRKYDFTKWWWKLEFHAPDDKGRGYAHWHLLIDYKRPIDVSDLSKAWDLGRTNIRGVRDSGFKYLFKYVSKSPDYLPQWFLDRTRVRLCQSSPGFYPSPAHGGRVVDKNGPSPRLGTDPTDANTQNNTPSKETIGERIERWARSAVSRTTLESGSSRYHIWELDRVTWGALLVQACELKISRSLSDAEFTIETTKIETTETWMHKLPVKYRSEHLLAA